MSAVFYSIFINSKVQLRGNMLSDGIFEFLNEPEQIIFADELRENQKKQLLAYLNKNMVWDRVLEVAQSSVVKTKDFWGNKPWTLMKTEQKTTCGGKFEVDCCVAFDLPKRIRVVCDTKIGEIDLDIKFTSGNDNWMISPKNINRWCLLVKANPIGNYFSYGLFFAAPEALNRPNRDKKHSISKRGMEEFTHWIKRDIPLGLQY
jgi:hypothetical protein